MAAMAIVQDRFSLRPCPSLAAFSAQLEVQVASQIRIITKPRDVKLLQQKPWIRPLCLQTGIGSGVSSSPRRTLGISQAFMVESPDVLIPKFLILRTAFLTEAAAVCAKWMLALAVTVSINFFMPWSTDVATALEDSLCDDVGQYYSQASGLKGANLKARLHEIVAGHKRLSYAQVWNALKILDAADTETSDTSPDIVDIYSLKRLPKSLQGSSEGWNHVFQMFYKPKEFQITAYGLWIVHKYLNMAPTLHLGEHLWPRSYGLMEGRPEFTDVHNLRPADVNVNSSRGNKYFGDCTTLKTTRCLIPANKEAGADTATDVNTWRPPSQVRGDIARAVFYMAVRYGIEQPSGNLNLQLSDSPSVGNATMGLLSTLLEWNNVDPPSPSEVLRNARVCSLYQGNRNPFVDHPEFASEIWGPIVANEILSNNQGPD